MRASRFLVAAVLWGVAGCGQAGESIRTDVVDVETTGPEDGVGPSDPGGIDPGVSADGEGLSDQGEWDGRVEPDAGDAFQEEDIPIGTPCHDNGDCGYGYCIELLEGKVCTQTCMNECPPGWNCEKVVLHRSDPEFICVPAFYLLCKECSKDEECGGEPDTCVPVGSEGTFCGLHCAAAEDCPQGYECVSVTGAGQAVSLQCVPLSKSCSCRPENQGAKRDCAITNDFGSCEGMQTCLGLEGWSVCDAPVPIAEECDGADNDCNGEVDDGFPDPDKDGLASCLDPDDDNDGVLDPKDNCPDVYNPDQSDPDKDELGNACDEDDDGDGDPDEIDCAPLVPMAYHGAKEICDGIDNNCNGQVDEGFADFDMDGLANCMDPDDDNDGELDDTDCDPLNADVFNGAMEACDGLDNDCNGIVDEGFPDSDGDGLANCMDFDTDNDGDPDVTDCAKLNNKIYHGAIEQCDGLDNNCNGQVDEGYADFDQDGLANCVDTDDDNDGDPDETDCAPLDPKMKSGGQEACDGIDNNCNGKVDEGYPNFDGDGEADCIDNDDDNDGDPDVVDCNPFDSQIFHGADEICDDQDNNCNLLVDEPGSTGCSMFYKDKDDDGWGMNNKSQCLCGPTGEYTASQPGDCDDSVWSINPDGSEVCNNADDDCDGTTDNANALGCVDYFMDKDSDGYGSGVPMCLCWPNGTYTTKNSGDCDENNPAKHPGIPEICNNLDDDCDGLVDEGVGSTCGNCDPTCHQTQIGPGGEETFTPDKENSSAVSKDPNGYLQLDKEQVKMAFIWISNSGEYTVTKMDTTNGNETGRYQVCVDPSRTAVDLYGDVWVGCRGDGGVAKIILYEKNCIDKNKNGSIETSRDLNNDTKISGGEMLAKGTDECVKFIAYPGGSCQRGLGVDKENHAWVGEWNSAILRRLEPENGVVVDSVSIPNNPYGLVIDGNGIIWVSGRGGNRLVRVDPKTKAVSTYTSNIGCFEPYGIGLDKKGRVWIGNCCCWNVAYRFDPATSSWAAAGTSGRPRGIVGAADGYVYVANDESSRVAKVNADNASTEGYIELGGGRFPVGMTVDFDGYVWAVNQSSSTASKADPKTMKVVLEHAVGSSPYTYSDMTGYMLHNYTAPQGFYQHVVPGSMTGITKWSSLNVDATTPGQSNVKIRLRAANTVAGVGQQAWKGPFGPFPPNLFPMDLSNIVGLDGKYLQVEINLIPDKDQNAPLLKGFTVQYHVTQ